MAITYDWVISSLDCYPEYQGHENVVFTIHWRRKATDGEHTVDVYGSQAITLDENSTFVPFDNLTKTKVVTWLESALGADAIKQLNANLNKQLLEISIVRPELPWA